jgi:hypothetical protein
MTRVEAGSNTSTVILRAVGGDEKESLKYEIVKYGPEYQGTRTRVRLRWQGPAAHAKDRPALSYVWAPHIKQDRNCQTVINTQSWAPYEARHRDLLTDRQSQCDFDFSLVSCTPIFSLERMLRKDNYHKGSVEKNSLVVGLKGLDAKTNWLAVHRQS